MKFNLILLKGTDSIKFGMTSEEIQSIMNVKPEPSKSIIDYDEEYYPKICKIFYMPNEEGKFICSEIGFYKPTKVFLDGVQLMGKPMEEVDTLFKSKFEDYIIDSTTSLMSEKYGISLYVPKLPRQKRTVDSVVISRKGYREQVDPLYKKGI